MDYINLNKAGQEKLGLKRIVLTRICPRPHISVVIWK